MNEYFNWLTFLPALFLLPPLPFIRNFFKGVDVTKFSYGAATSGIFLTFFGIWEGLIGFDVANTEASLPLLVEGLKLAFGSSVVGLGTSMIINLIFVSSKDETEAGLEDVTRSITLLNDSIKNFTSNSSEMQTRALTNSIERLIKDLELGINTETHEVMVQFRHSVEFLRKWQEKYVDEIAVVTEAMDKNAQVTIATSEQLDRTNDALAQLAPVTEQIADSIGWVRKALPTMRKKGVRPIETGIELSKDDK